MSGGGTCVPPVWWNVVEARDGSSQARRRWVLERAFANLKEDAKAFGIAGERRNADATVASHVGR